VVFSQQKKASAQLKYRYYTNAPPPPPGLPTAVQKPRECMNMEKDKIFVITNQKENLHDVVAPDAWFRKLSLTNVLPSFSSIVKIRIPV
jgi:hypothetical protein